MLGRGISGSAEIVLVGFGWRSSRGIDSSVMIGGGDQVSATGCNGRLLIVLPFGMDGRGTSSSNWRKVGVLKVGLIVLNRWNWIANRLVGLIG